MLNNKLYDKSNDKSNIRRKIIELEEKMNKYNIDINLKIEKLNSITPYNYDTYYEYLFLFLAFIAFITSLVLINYIDKKSV